MGFRNRGLIVEQLLRELLPDLEDEPSEEAATEHAADAEPFKPSSAPVDTGRDRQAGTEVTAPRS
ncbi:MAG: hypothetical protein ACO3FN_08400, partial [Vulcanococcus sp.]